MTFVWINFSTINEKCKINGAFLISYDKLIHSTFLDTFSTNFPKDEMYKLILVCKRNNLFYLLFLFPNKYIGGSLSNTAWYVDYICSVDVNAIGRKRLLWFSQL